MDSVSLIKNRLTFRQVAEYVKKPIVLLDVDSLIDSFYLETRSDNSDTDCDVIPNALADLVDDPPKILTLHAYKKMIKNSGGNFKYIDKFTDCFKTVFEEQVREITNETKDENVDDLNIVNEPKVSDQEDSPILNDILLGIDIPDYDELVKACESDDEDYSEDESIYWKLLELNNSNEIDEAILSEYEPVKKHWLDCPPVSWYTIEKSKKKCMEWLNKYC